jgi:hypothetical protein
MMRTETIARHQSTFDTGTVTVSLAHITLSDRTDYYEVAVLDSRPLDLRKHRWSVVETYVRASRAHEVFDVVVDAVHLGHIVFGLTEADAA